MTSDDLPKESPHVSIRHGLWLPNRFRVDSQIVIRTPVATIQHWGGFDGYYSLVDETHFDNAENLRDPRNPDLAPHGVSIKIAGEDAEAFEEIELINDA